MTKLEKTAMVASIVASLAAASALLWNVYVFQKTSNENKAVLKAHIERQNKTLAIELYQDYLNLAFIYPDFAFDEVDFLKLSEQDGKKYLVFASSALTIAGQIFELQKGSEEMEKIVVSIVRNHLFFINQGCEEIDKSFLQYLSKTFRELKCT